MQDIYQFLTDQAIINDERLSGKDQLLTVQNKIIIPIESLKKSKKSPQIFLFVEFSSQSGPFFKGWGHGFFI